jgi:AmmeMemoRadiSam system protein A
MHPLVALAKEAVELYIRSGSILAIPEHSLSAELTQQAGVFVCLKTKGLLRGCVGTFQPAEPNVAHEVVRNAISAATCDSRFACIGAHELEALEYSVDVLSPPEAIADKSMLDPKRYGVIVQAGGRRGLLLPDLEGVDTAEAQLSIAMEKAGIAPGTPIKLFRFEVKRYH